MAWSKLVHKSIFLRQNAFCRLPLRYTGHFTSPSNNQIDILFSHQKSSTQQPSFKVSSRNYSSAVKGNFDLLKQLLHDPNEYAKQENVLDSIVKVFSVHSRPNYFLPWQNHPKRESTGTGFVVHNRIILTNAHVVADSTFVLVKRHGSGTKYRADVQAVGHNCDLALLSVEDEDFWTTPSGMGPLQLGGVPELQQAVVVLGYPTGGDNTSVTSGVVSRVEVAQYAHAASHLMAIQIDAAINSGNSGGPAMDKSGNVVGVAFQNLPQADNIGYIIPIPVVQHFLYEVARFGRYPGFCSLGALVQNLENPHLREAVGMSSHMSGVLLNTIQATSQAAKVLQKGDVLMEFDGVPIANDGSVHLRLRERIYFSYLITLKRSGHCVDVKVLRNGEPQTLQVTLSPNEALVPVHQYDQLPRYFIFGGIVFTPLTQPYLHEYGDDWVNACPRRLYDKAMHSLIKTPGEQIVIVSQVLVDDVNMGYQQFQNLQVLKVDGVEVLNLRHLQHLIEKGASCPFDPSPNALGTMTENSSSMGVEGIISGVAPDVISNGEARGQSQAASCLASAVSSTSNDKDTIDTRGSGDSSASVLTTRGDADGEQELLSTLPRFVRIELEDDRLMILDRRLAAAAAQRIMERYRVPRLTAVDL